MEPEMRKRTARKYVPTKDVITTLFNGDLPLQGDERTKVLTTVHAAALSLARGDGEKSSWDALVSAMNIGLILCETAGNKEIGLQALYDAQNALIDAAERYNATGRLVFGPGGLPALNGGIHVFEQIVDTVTRRQYVRASDEVLRRLNAGKAVQIRRGRTTERFELRRAA
jgi:hypothetical protein